MHRCKVHFDMLSSRSDLPARETASRWLDKRRGAVETARRLKLRTTEVGRKLGEVGSFRAWLTARSCIRASVNSTNTWPRIPSPPRKQPHGTLSEGGHVSVHFASHPFRFTLRFIFLRIWALLSSSLREGLLDLSDIFSSSENQFFQCF